MQRQYSVVDVDGAGVSSVQGPVARSMGSAKPWLRSIQSYNFLWSELTLANADLSSSNSGLNFRD